MHEGLRCDAVFVKSTEHFHTSADMASKSLRSSSNSIRSLVYLCIGVSTLLSTVSGRENSVLQEKIFPVHANQVLLTDCCCFAD